MAWLAESLWATATGARGPSCLGLLEWHLGVEPGVVRQTDSEGASEATHEGSLHLFCAEEKTVGRHGAGVAAGLAPAQAEAKEDKGDGWELGELRHELLSSFQFPLQFPSTPVLGCEDGSQQREALVRWSIPLDPPLGGQSPAKVWLGRIRTSMGSDGGLCRRSLSGSLRGRRPPCPLGNLLPLCAREHLRDNAVKAEGKEQGPNCWGFVLVRTRRNRRSCSTSPGQVRLFGSLARSRTCRSGSRHSRGPRSGGTRPGRRSGNRRHLRAEWTAASHPLVVQKLSCAGCRPGVMFLVTVASCAFAVRRLQVSPTATERCLSSFFQRCERETTRCPRPCLVRQGAVQGVQAQCFVALRAAKFGF